MMLPDWEPPSGVFQKEAAWPRRRSSHARKWTPGEHQDSWGALERLGWEAVISPDETTAEATRRGSTLAECCRERRRGPAGQSLAGRHQSDGMAARPGASELHAPRTAWRDPGDNGLGGHPPLRFPGARGALRVLGAVGVVAGRDPGGPALPQGGTVYL